MKNQPNGAILIRCTKKLHKRIKDEAELMGVSLNQYIVNLLTLKVGCDEEDSEDECEGTHRSIN